MNFVSAYAEDEPTREEIDAQADALVLEFGTDWCSHCRNAQPLIETAFDAHENIRHIKIEDGSGKPLGRSFRIKLWPTLIFLKDGKEIARVVRPRNAEEVNKALKQLDSKQNSTALSAGVQKI